MRTDHEVCCFIDFLAIEMQLRSVQIVIQESLIFRQLSWRLVERLRIIMARREWMWVERRFTHHVHRGHWLVKLVSCPLMILGEEKMHGLENVEQRESLSWRFWIRRGRWVTFSKRMRFLRRFLFNWSWKWSRSRHHLYLMLCNRLFRSFWSHRWAL